MKLIIIGGGFSGKYFSLCLQKFYTDIQIFDYGGKGHYKHIHILNKFGQDMLFKNIPQLKSKLKKETSEVNWTSGTIWKSALGNFPNYQSDFKTFSFSREYLENLLFAEIKKHKNISFINKKVLKISKYKNNIISIEDNINTHKADHFIFACGINKTLFTKENNIHKIKIKREKVKKINISYQSKIINNISNIKIQSYHQILPPIDNYGFILTPIENNKLIKTNIIKGIFSKKQINTYTKKNMYKREFEKISNAIFVGDCICGLNPVFGQSLGLITKQAELTIKHLNKKNSLLNLQKKIYRSRMVPYYTSLLGSQDKVNFLNKYLINYFQYIKNSPKLHFEFINIIHFKLNIFKIIKLKPFLNCFNFKNIGPYEHKQNNIT